MNTYFNSLALNLGYAYTKGVQVGQVLLFSWFITSPNPKIPQLTLTLRESAHIDTDF